MQISLAIENKRRNHNNDAYDSVSPNVDSLLTKLKHNVFKSIESELRLPKKITKMQEAKI